MGGGRSEYTPWLSTAGGVVGSLVGPVGTVAGSGAGAYIGSKIDNPNANAGVEAAKYASLAGLGEAAAPIVGAVVDPLVKSRLAQRLQFGALRPKPKLLARDPDMIEGTLKEGVPIGEAGDMSGWKKYGELMGASSAAERELAGVSPSSRTWDPREVLQQMRDEIDNARPGNQTTKIVDDPEWQALEAEFLERFKAPTSPRSLPDIPAPRPLGLGSPRPIGGPPSQRVTAEPISGMAPGIGDVRLSVPEVRTARANMAEAEGGLIGRSVRGAAQRIRPTASEVPEHNPFTLEDVLTEKKRADARATATHQRRENRTLGNNVSVSNDTDELFNATLANVLRNNIRAVDPKLGEQMLRSGSLMARRAAMLSAEARPDAISLTNPLHMAVSLLGGRAPSSRLAMNLYRGGQAPRGMAARYLPGVTRFGPRMLPAGFPPQEDQSFFDWLDEQTR